MRAAPVLLPLFLALFAWCPRDGAGRPNQGQVIRTPLRTLKGHTNVIMAVAFSHDGTMLATASADGTAAIWDTATWTQRQAFDVTARSVAFSRNDQILALGQGTLLDVTTGQPAEHPAVEQGTIAVAFSPDGRSLASVHADGTVKLWDTGTWKPRPAFRQAPGFVSFLIFSPDGKTLAVGGEHSVAYWNLTTGRKIRVLKGKMDAVASGAFSPNGRLFATGGCSNFSAQLWDVRTGRQLRSLRSHTNAITSVAFTPDGKRLATGSIDFHAKLWDVKTGRLLYSFVDHGERIYCLAISADGKLLATGDAYAKTKIWALPP